MLTAFLLRGLTGKIIVGLALLILAVAVAGGAATLAGTDPLTPDGAAADVRACSYAEQLPPPGDTGLGGLRIHHESFSRHIELPRVGWRLLERPGNLGGYDSCESAVSLADSCAL